MKRFIPIAVLLFVPGCAVDPYLTCGPKCTEGGTAPDANMSADSGGGGTDSGKTDSGGMCRQSGADCFNGGDCCSGFCGSSQKCETSCQPQGQSCMSSPDNCCIGFYCNGTCVQCIGLNMSCSSSVQCCSGRCQSFDGGPKLCVPD